QILLRLGECLVDAFFGTQWRCVVRFLPSRMPFGAVIVGQYELALLISAHRRVQLADQFFCRLGLGFRSTHDACAHGCEGSGGPDRPEKVAPALHLWQIKSFIALWAIVLGFVEHGVFLRQTDMRGFHKPACGTSRWQLVIVDRAGIWQIFLRNAFDRTWTCRLFASPMGQDFWAIGSMRRGGSSSGRKLIT